MTRSLTGSGAWAASCAASVHWISPVELLCISRPGFPRWLLQWCSENANGIGQAPLEPNNIPFTVLGAGLLWMGWFGFNGGSALAANGLAVNALVTTNTAAAAAAVVWMFLSWRDNKPSVLGIVTGAVVGLVAITPAAGFVTPMAAILIGGLAAPISYYAIRLRQKWGLDESLDVWACHGMGGTWGALATGLFATKLVNSAGADGLFYGNPSQFADPGYCGARVHCIRFWRHICDCQIIEQVHGSACHR